MSLKLAFFKCWSILLFASLTQSTSDKPLMLLVSFDGFRWDYLSMYNLTNFNTLKNMGAHADYIINSFSTITFPNHWSIVTGLYEESHGIIQNNMFDPVLNKTFTYTDPQSQTIEWFGQNRLAEPIWATNQRGGDGRRSAAEWIGSNITFSNQKILNITYSRTTPFKELIDRFVKFYTDNSDPINFGALYFDEPDHTGHMYGPYSVEMKDKLDELDAVLGYMLDEFMAHGLFDKLNLIITSDHGMEAFSSNTTIFLDSHIDTELFNAYGSRACYTLFVKKVLDLEYVYKTLKTIKHIDVYKHEEIPEELRYKHNVRLGDMVIVTHIGYAVYINNQTVDWKINNGDHGYYNNESAMHPIFIAHGPAFKNNFKTRPFKNVDIYPLMCRILGVEPAVHNGTLENVKDMLVKKNMLPGFGSAFKFMVLIVLPGSLVLIVVFYVLIVSNKKRTMKRSEKADDHDCQRDVHTKGYFTSIVDSQTPLYTDCNENEAQK